MDLQHAVTHYRRLIKEAGWLEEGMAWTVILPVSGDFPCGKPRHA
ncbi:hypothetical protein ACIBCT_01355 [Streptosporangium sp. NPDC050855]